jgi:hypothetical protein
MATGGYGLHEVLPGPALPCLLFPMGGSPQGGLMVALGVAHLRVGGLRPSPFPLDTPHRAPVLILLLIHLSAFTHLLKQYRLKPVFHPEFYIMNFKLPVLI